MVAVPVWRVVRLALIAVALREHGVKGRRVCAVQVGIDIAGIIGVIASLSKGRVRIVLQPLVSVLLLIALIKWLVTRISIIILIALIVLVHKLIERIRRFDLHWFSTHLILLRVVVALVTETWLRLVCKVLLGIALLLHSIVLGVVHRLRLSKPARVLAL